MRADRESAALATLAAAVGALATAVTAGALAAGVAGVALVAVGAWRGPRLARTGGLAALTCAVLLAGFAGAGAGTLLVGTVCLLVAWDLAARAADLRGALGPGARATDATVTRAAATLALTAGSAAAAYLAKSAVPRALPATATLALLLGALALAAALDPRAR